MEFQKKATSSIDKMVGAVTILESPSCEANNNTKREHPKAKSLPLFLNGGDLAFHC